MGNRYLEHANAIPEMGNGGKIIGSALHQAARDMREGLTIVDIAPFLGSTTAFLACGLLEAVNDSSIIAIDKWALDEKYLTWLNKRGIYVDDLQEEFIKNMAPYMAAGVDIQRVKTDFFEYSYPNRYPLIGILVDDICSGKKYTDHLIKSLSSWFVENETLLFLLDFYWFEDRNDYKCRLYQSDFMNENKNVFEYLGRPPKSKTAIFKYKGGDIKYLDGAQYDDYFLPTTGAENVN